MSVLIGDGITRRFKNRDFNKIARPGLWTEGTSWAEIRFFSLLSPTIKLNDEYEISFSYWPTNIFDPDGYILLYHNKKAADLKFRNMLDLFSCDGELLYSVYNDDAIPEYGKPVYVDQFGKLYTLVYDPYPQVQRYKVIIKH